MNRLAAERSPYLLQHAENPVDWYPWGAEAFEKARRENKPIFLSVGYSTCHWCHVMEHESFENAAVAAALNADFVSIKVDREERPDVDRVYMTFVQSTSGSGGWPMTVFLTPELKPFFGGTYFPPTSRWGRPGFLDLLQELSRAWKDDRARVDSAAAELFDRLKTVTGSDGRSKAQCWLAGPDTLAEAVEQFQTAFDRRNGGFGEAPKFPRPAELLLLLREHSRTRTAPPLVMALDTLRAMALGGMRDHVGGGFHRYSVDAQWRVPHFEKMLYDQAQLALAYLEAGQATNDGFYSAIAEDTLGYVLRDLRSPEGGFYSAEDADSLPSDGSGEKREGAFYVWTDEEIGTLLGDDAEFVRKRFGIEPGGNAPQDPQQEFTNQNLFYTARSIEDIAARTGRTPDEVIDAIGRSRQVLFEARAKRHRPHLDDKIITSWNGMMIAAFARAARVLPTCPDTQEYLATARSAAEFIKGGLWNGAEQRLLRRYRDGEAAIDAYAEDYASLIWGLIELFQADGDPAWLEWARDLQARQDALFWDEAEAGWFSTTGKDPSVLLRLKEDYDGAEPSASAISVLNLIALAHLLDDEDARRKAERTLARYGPNAGRAGRVIPLMLAGLSTWHAAASQVVVLGERDGQDTTALKAEISRHYLPFAVVIPVDPGEQQARLATLMPFIGAMRMQDGGAAAFVCRNFACKAPVSTPETLGSQLEEP
ncbi:MAG: thioredoxin domain-containing protein [Acidobacteria bacterium]|nr:MAG: thioredoxin domain-containing protein [Acidobacteriota bacterium]